MFSDLLFYFYGQLQALTQRKVAPKTVSYDEENPYEENMSLWYLVLLKLLGCIQTHCWCSPTWPLSFYMLLEGATALYGTPTSKQSWQAIGLERHSAVLSDNPSRESNFQKESFLVWQDSMTLLEGVLHPEEKG